MGLRVYVALTAKEMASMLDLVDAVILSVQPERMLEWRKQVTALRPVPVLLWCDHLTFPSSGCKLDTELDGMLTATMSPSELHCSLLLGFNQFIERRGWQQEREQLLSKLEERKWIDQAKTVLCEVKQISEAEAYDFLRKQAMNERKRIVDVATSIVKVYQLLRDQKQGGR
ncbi:ANTAR domain-containing protein [Paenibacillus thalictri]|uniref:ANTAR domain-containing protein n=2 Tax=Paenibacillus thalictri TaxID=2527873 RepID=A0A4Q9DP12_9BACL|nr:ANTAR domain-containing protein [Paenibacillus thalictri]